MNLSKRTLVAAAVAVFVAAPAMAAEITGAGATFPYPVYAKWAEAYKAKTGTGLNYQSIGSGGGIKQIKAGTVDFGASDKPLQPDELNAAGLVQWPQIMGGVVPVVNVPGITGGQLKLTGPVLADIFMGKVKKWDDAAIADLNKGVKLPDLAINVVHRSDGSGTTFLFTNYLGKVSPEWAKGVGSDSSVSWPVGVGGKGNEGVASYVKTINGSIGYVEYAYALQNKMAHAALKNAAGQFVQPEDKAFQAAAANADWKNAPGYYLVLTEQPGKESWSITGASFILMHKEVENTATAHEVLQFFEWAYHNGQGMAKELAYVPMPESVVKMIEASWATELKGKDGKPVWK